MKVVSPYRPFAPESPAHRKLGRFDWVGALEMLRESVTRSCGCETFALTDVDTTLPGPTHQYVTEQRRLMVWILEVCLCYLESEDFDQDTVMLSPDLLVFQDLRPWFTADLGVLIRSAEKYRHRPLLNACQWWRHAAKDRLVAFYRQALAIAPTLPENCLRWGADTEALIPLLSPIQIGLVERAGLQVRCIESAEVLTSLPDIVMARLSQHCAPGTPTAAVVDFKFWRRKPFMRQYFDATLGAAVLA